jgi:hypothetical protein
MHERICTRCVMDNVGDDTITFEADGTCNYCNYALSRMDAVYFPNQVGKRRLESMIQILKTEGRKRDFDCLMGLSGGLDSSYLAYLAATNWGLRILAVHVDDGFDTDTAKRNIKNLCGKFDIRLVTDRPDRAQYMDLTRSFIRAGVPAIAIPQDNVLLASLGRCARRYGLRYFLSGANFALESVLQRGNTHNCADVVHIRAIHKAYGEVPLTTLPLTALFERYIGQKYISRVSTLRPLDLIDYNRARAIQELRENAEFDYYGGKHYESIFTKFVQVYYLPRKFGVDKRKSHLSSLIVSGQMEREQALDELRKPLYEEYEMEIDISYILGELGISRNEFDGIMREPGKSHSDYRVSALVPLAGVARRLRRLLSD